MKKNVKVKAVNPPPAGQKEKQNHAHQFPWIYAAVVVVAAFVSMWPSLSNQLTNWDDPSYLTDNPLITSLSSANIKKIFTEPYFGNYQPLHILSYAIEYHFFGLSPAGYHGVSIFMHVLCALLVFVFVYRLVPQKYVAFGVTLLFAVSPLRTESVCWASERKDLLYAIFFFGAAITYLRYLKTGFTLSNYIITFILFSLAVMSKVMAVSFVPVMFLLDYYNNRKWNAKAIADKLLFVAASLLMGIIEVQVVKAEGTMDVSGQYTFAERVFMASHNIFMYIVKIFVPYNQSAYYPYPAKVNGYLPMEYYIAAIVPVLMLIVLFLTYRKNKILFFGLSFYIVTIFLVLMLVPVGPTVFSERYTYIPCVGIYFVACHYLLQLSMHWKKNALAYMVAVSAVGIVYTIQTRQRCTVWKDSLTLWTDATHQATTAAHALNNLGDAYYKLGQVEEAKVYFEMAAKNNPDYAQAWFNLGNCNGQTGKYAEALSNLNKAISLNSKYADAYNKRGQAYSMLNNVEAAKADYEHSLQLKPGNAEVYFNLGVMYLNINNKVEACKYFSTAADMGFAQAAQARREVCQ